MSKLQDALRRYWPLPAVLALHCWLQYAHLQLDFWNDELYTLRHFILVPLSNTASHYPVPNNHILFSLLANLWAKLLGIHTMQDAIRHIVALRLLPLFFSGLCLVFVFLAARKLASSSAAMLAALLLVTTIPFYNFSAQMRGYSLSMCFAAAIAYVVISAWRKATPRAILRLFLLSLLCLYTLPTNLYFLLTLLGIIPAAAVLLRQGREDVAAPRAAMRMSLAIGAGILAAGLLYLPLYPQMAGWLKSSEGSAAGAFPSTLHAMPIVAYHFLSARYLLAFPLVFFFWKERRLRFAWIWLMAALFLLPFLLTDLRPTEPPHRVFLTVLPLLCLGLGIALERAISLLKKGRARILALVAIVGYCIGVMAFQIRHTKQVALADITKGNRRLDLYYQYCLQSFQPKEDAATYLRHFADPKIPLLDACATENDLRKYIELQGRTELFTDSISLQQAIKLYPVVDVCTELPQRLQDSLRNGAEMLSFQPLLQGVHRIQIVRISRATH